MLKLDCFPLLAFTDLFANPLLTCCSDPADDGAGRGKCFPDGPWRVAGDAAYGSAYIGNGDPSALDGSSAFVDDRITVDEVFSVNNTFNLLPPVPSMPISSAVALELVSHAANAGSGASKTGNKSAAAVFGSRWSGAGIMANASLSVDLSGRNGSVFLAVENANKYEHKNVTNVVITVKGSREADRYVIVGAQRDSAQAAAGGAGSGNAVFLELLRALGDLLANGWVPHRTLLLASFDAEQFGSVGSSAWIDRHFSHLGGRGIVYLNLHDVVRGSGSLHVEAGAALRRNIYLMAASIAQPEAVVDVNSFFSTSKTRRLEAGSGTSGDSTDSVDKLYLPFNASYAHEDLPDSGDSVYYYWLEDSRKRAGNAAAELPDIDLPGRTGRLSPFLARLAIPTVELDFDGGYFGVEGSANDSFEWMSKFGDPAFTFHRAAAELYGSVLLSFSDSIFLQYDFLEVARDLRHGELVLASALDRAGLAPAVPLTRLRTAVEAFELAANEAVAEMKQMTVEMTSILNGELVVDFKRVREMNTRLLLTEKAFLLPSGPPRMPWLKHVRCLTAVGGWVDGGTHALCCIERMDTSRRSTASRNGTTTARASSRASRSSSRQATR